MATNAATDIASYNNQTADAMQTQDEITDVWRLAPTNRKRQADSPPVNNSTKKNIPNYSTNDPRINGKLFTTKNRFDLLNNIDTPVDSNESQIKNQRPPPIYLRTEVHFLEFIKFLTSIVNKDTFTCVSTAKGITIYPTDSTAYRTIVKSLRDNNVEFYTYQLQEDKPFRAVIRGLHYSIDEKEITQALIEIGFKVRKVTNIISRDKIKLPLHFIDLEPNCTNNNDIFNLKSLLMSRITVETPRNSRLIVQCTRCQTYGHTKGYCTLAPRCVKCAGPHESKICGKNRETPAKCVLCNGAHPANYRGCSAHRELQNRRASNANREKNYTSSSPPDFNSSSFPSLPTSSHSPLGNQPNPHRVPTVSYAQATTRSAIDSESLNTSLNHHMSSFLTEMKSLFTPIITLMTQLIEVILRNGK